MKSLMTLMPLALAAAGCAEDLRHDHGEPDAGTTDVDGAPPPSHVTTTDHDDGTATTRIDATSSTEWVYLDLEGPTEVAAADPDWDLAFQRFKIMIDGGVSGPGGMAIAVLPGADFAAMAAAPAADYITDAPDGDDMDADPDLAFLQGDGWYSYDPQSHVLSPRDHVYVVRSVEGGYFKLKMTSFYDDAGTSGFPTFRWGAINPPAGQ